MIIDGNKIIEECNEQMGLFSSISNNATPSLSKEKSGPFSRQLPNATPAAATDSILSSLIEEQEKNIWNINNSVVNININIVATC